MALSTTVAVMLLEACDDFSVTRPSVQLVKWRFEFQTLFGNVCSTVVGS